MSVPYPLTSSGPRSQNTDHLDGIVTRYIEQHLDRTVGWDEVKLHLETQHGKTAEEAGSSLLRVVLDLEWTGVIQYDVDSFRRPGQPNDAAFAPLPEVAGAVLALGWPRPSDGKRSRKIYDCFVELGGRYRHCDVYWAMHEVLKGKRLACHRAYWSKLGDAAILADPTLEPWQRAEIEQIIEAELCDDYVAFLGRKVDREYQLGLEGRRADIFDRDRKLIIEAKANADSVVVLGAIGQAMLYRTIANQDRDVVDRIAVLLPGKPSDLAREVVRTNDLDVDVIWRDGRTFRHEQFG